MNSSANRRQFKRLRIDRSVKIPIQLFPKMPFIGESTEAILNNISAGGMALLIKDSASKKTIKQGIKIKIHFRLPGKPLQACLAKVTHSFHLEDKTHLIGIRFAKLPKSILHELKQMASDNELCDKRIQQDSNPWCLPTCSFLNLCRKPIRTKNHAEASNEHLEMAFQTAD